MNSKNIIGIGLVVITVAMALTLMSSAGASTVRLVGKAAWYLPYISLVSAVRCLVRA